jgi:hypothetical protein
MELPKFIRYNEAYEILHRKHKVTHDEFRYWVLYDSRPITWNPHFYETDYTHRIISHISDIPDDRYGNEPGYQICKNKFEPRYCFYHKKTIQKYNPNPRLRFVCIKDLPVRFWHKWDRVEHETICEYPSLEYAAKNYMLRFYDKDRDEFTLEKTWPINGKKELWYYTPEGKQMLNDHQTFFLLEDIIHIERVFNNRPLEDCINELKINFEDSND